MSKRPDTIEEILRIAEGYAETYSKDLDKYLEDFSFGSSKASPEDERAFVAMMLQQNPPEWFRFPDGTVEFVSPWVLCLREGLVEDAGPYWKNVERILEEMKTATPRGMGEMRPQRGMTA